MSDLFVQTGQELAALAEKHEAVLVALSGGKDSLAVLSLCTQFFRRVVAYHLHFVPGLRCLRERLAVARQRWPSVDILEYPAPVFMESLKNWWYSDSDPRYQALPKLSINDFGSIAQRQTGIKLVANGMRYGDYRNRRQQIKGQKRKDIIYPIADWSKAHVLKYLLTNNIPAPANDGRESAGINLTTTSLLWLSRAYPDDFEKIGRFFPYISAARYRRDFFGASA